MKVRNSPQAYAGIGILFMLASTLLSACNDRTEDTPTSQPAIARAPLATSTPMPAHTHADAGPDRHTHSNTDGHTYAYSHQHTHSNTDGHAYCLLTPTHPLQHRRTRRRWSRPPHPLQHRRTRLRLLTPSTPTPTATETPAPHRYLGSKRVRGHA